MPTTHPEKQFSYKTPNVVSPGIPQFSYKTPNVVSPGIPQNPQYIIHNKYIITEKLGKGKFGEVYKGHDIQTNEIIAIKLEHHMIPKTNPYSKNNSTKQNDLHILKHETRILNYLHNRRCRNIPYIYWFGIQSGIPALVMPYYECSLFDLYTQTTHTHSKYKYSIQRQQTPEQGGTTCADVRGIAGDGPSSKVINQRGFILEDYWKPADIFRSIIRIVENIHASGVVHRDIKPHNFMVKNRELVLIDFGMATFYVDQNNRHIPELETPKQHLLGTQKYISINIHYGKEYTRRDDLISVGYVYLFLCNWLFWDRVYISTDVIMENTICINDQYPETHISHPKNICFKMSKELSNIEKCLSEITDDNSHLPILEYLRYVYALGFNQTPNYDCSIYGASTKEMRR